MWRIVIVSSLLSSAYGKTITDFTQVENKTDSAYQKKSTTGVTEKVNELKILKPESFQYEMTDSAPSAINYVGEKSKMESTHPTARKLKYKRAELKFIMKTLIILKVILGLFLPLAVMASKIISWKAVTLSLMAFMLAKILFIKNFLTGKNMFSVTPTNFVPPLLIHGGQNDAIWKRQGDPQNLYHWSST